MSYDKKESSVSCTFLTESETQSKKYGVIHFGPASRECKNLSEVEFGTASSSAAVQIDLNIDKICLSVNASVNNVQTVIVEGIYTDSGMCSKIFFETVSINDVFLSLQHSTLIMMMMVS